LLNQRGLIIYQISLYIVFNNVYQTGNFQVPVEGPENTFHQLLKPRLLKKVKMAGIEMVGDENNTQDQGFEVSNR
jgi:hypothetical protein